MQNTDLPVDDDPFITRDPPYPRLSFPNNESRQSRFRTEPAKTAAAGLTPPMRRGSPLNPHKANVPLDQRSRVWPSEPSLGPSKFPSRHRRNPSLGFQDTSPRTSKAPHEPDMEVGAFSNEYDLSHEEWFIFEYDVTEAQFNKDPRILQDVQRALQIKARREARLRRESTSGQDIEPSHTVPQLLQTPPPKTLPSRFSPSSSFSPPSSRKLSSSTSSDVDFSPSTGMWDVPIQSHPVPSSLDSGMTLDWTGTQHDEQDKRWAMKAGKRKERDKLPPLGLMLEQQEHTHKEKLARVNGLASGQTVRKARIIGDQLGRQYQLIFNSLEKGQPLNLAEARRWYLAQDLEFRNSVEGAEPFTWSKHLHRREGYMQRNSWDLSALTMEEYISSRTNMKTIPEDSPLPDSDVAPKKPRTSLLASPQRPGLKDYHSQPWKMLLDDRISFEPLSDTRRNSFDDMSRKSAESALSSIRSGSSNLPTPSMPTLLHQISDLKDDIARSVVTPLRSPSAYTPSVLSHHSDNATLVVPELVIQAPSSESTAFSSPPHPIPISQSASNESSSSNQPSNLSPTRQSFSSFKGPFKSRSLRTAFPFAERLTRRPKAPRRNKEDILQKEYEEKAKLLSDAEGHNSRMRSLLSRMATTIKEYESIRSTTFELLGIVQGRLPKDLVDAFGHDPAAVTGPTRKLKGWHAVEDIHERLLRQRRILRDFLCTYEEPQGTAHCLLDDPIADIIQTLEYLEDAKVDLMFLANSVRERLKDVQALHVETKEGYNKAVSTISVVYPQLSHIVALEESYRDQYQQFWDLGMDALTLLLDTVTPFWRTYGKTIGEDIRDFLVIPLYRNEFTGEAKRYRIKVFPKRSLHHWIGLVFFFFLSIGVNILQARAAVSSSLHFRLQVIPYHGVRWTALPIFWIGIVIQWLAVIFEFAIVFTQIGTVIWWAGWSVKLCS